MTTAKKKTRAARPPKALKVYGYYGLHGSERLRVMLGDAKHQNQVRFLVATTSLSAAARLFGSSDPRQCPNLGETGNEAEVAVCLESPRTVFVHSLAGSVRQSGILPYAEFEE